MVRYIWRCVFHMYEEIVLDDMKADTEAAAAPARRYALSLKGDGMAVEREIDEATALEVVALLMSGGGTIPVSESRGIKHQIPRARSRGKQGLREYMDSVEAKRNPDKILAIANYATGETEKNTVTRADVRARFKDAAEPVPGNYGRDFRWVVKNGWLAADDSDKNEFHVTDTGHEALNQKFSPEIKKRTGVSKGRRGVKRRPKKATTS